MHHSFDMETTLVRRGHKKKRQGTIRTEYEILEIYKPGVQLSINQRGTHRRVEKDAIEVCMVARRFDVHSALRAPKRRVQRPPSSERVG